MSKQYLTPKIELLNAKSIKFNEVVQIYKAENNLTTESVINSRTLYLLSVANNFFGGWVSGELSHKQIQRIILPHHKHSSVELISPQGASLKETVLKLKNNAAEYIIKNKDCVEIIDSFETNKISTIYLSLGVLSDSENEVISSFKEYREIENKENVLVHLDGLHKLLYLGLRNNKENIKIIVACKKDSPLYKTTKNIK